MKEYPLLERTYIVSDGREQYKNYRNQYQVLAQEYVNQYRNEYVNKFKDIDSVIDGAVNLGDSMIMEIIENVCIPEIVSKGFYTYNANKFASEYYLDNYYVLGDKFNIIADKYAEIVFSQEQMQQYRQMRKDTRGRWMGGGFGIGGAVKGAVKAGAMNMVTGAAHSAVNAVGNAMTNAQTNSKKRQLFNDSETLNTISDGFYQSVYNLSKAMVDFMMQNSDNKPEPVTLEDIQEAKIILDNLKKYESDDTTTKDQIFRVLYLNPFNRNLYRFILEKYGNQNNEVYNVANEFGIDLGQDIIQPVQETFSAIDFNDKESLKEGEDNIINESLRMGMDPMFYLEKIDTETDRIEKEDEIKAKIKEMTVGVREKYKLIEPVIDKIKSFKDNSIDNDRELIKSLISDIDGNNGYVEWALYDIFNDSVIKWSKQVADRKADPDAASNAIDILLQIYDDEISKELDQLKGQVDLGRTMSLNVLRSAINGAAIRGINTIYNTDICKIRPESIENFEESRDIYKQHEEEDLSQLKLYGQVICEGAKQGSALACILYAYSIFEHSKSWNSVESYIKTAADKNFPEALLIEGLNLTNEKGTSGIMNAYPYLALATMLEIDNKLDIDEDTAFAMCQSADTSLITLDGLVMFVTFVIDQTDAIGITGYIMCENIKPGCTVSVRGSDKVYKGDIVISGILNMNGKAINIAHKNESVALIALRQNVNFEVEENDLVYLKKA